MCDIRYRIYFIVRMDERVSWDQSIYAKRLRFLNIGTVLLISAISAVYLGTYFGFLNAETVED